MIQNRAQPIKDEKLSENVIWLREPWEFFYLQENLDNTFQIWLEDKDLDERFFGSQNINFLDKIFVAWTSSSSSKTW
jgi:hypothetical protein